MDIFDGIVVTNLLRGVGAFGGWVVQIRGDGEDKSDLHVVHVREEPGYAGELVHRVKGGRPFQRKGATVFRYRSEARAEKKRIGWTSNYNSWNEQIDS